jgi:hypothetical protein
MTVVETTDRDAKMAIIQVELPKDIADKLGAKARTELISRNALARRVLAREVGYEFDGA